MMTARKNDAVDDADSSESLPLAEFESVLVVDQCSAAKAAPEEVERLDCREVDAYRRGDLVVGSADCVAAGDLYVGDQQRAVDAGVRSLRRAGVSVDRRYLSAGFGIVAEEESLPPYDCTFARMSRDAIRRRAARLGIPEDVLGLVSEGGYDCAVFALAAEGYSRSARLREAVERAPAELVPVVMEGAELDEPPPDVVTLEPERPSGDAEGIHARRGERIRAFCERVARGRRRRSES